MISLPVLILCSLLLYTAHARCKNNAFFTSPIIKVTGETNPYHVLATKDSATAYCQLQGFAKAGHIIKIASSVSVGLEIVDLSTGSTCPDKKGSRCKIILSVECIPKVGGSQCQMDADGNIGYGNQGSNNFGSFNQGSDNVGNGNHGANSLGCQNHGADQQGVGNAGQSNTGCYAKGVGITSSCAVTISESCSSTVTLLGLVPMKVYVSNTDGNLVNICSTDGAKVYYCVASYGNFKGPAGIFVDSAQKKVYIVNEVGNTVSICDTDNTRLSNCVATKNIGLAEPNGMFVDVSNKKAYMGNEEGKSVTICDVTDDSKLQNCGNSTIKKQPTGVFVVGSKVYVTSEAGNYISICDTDNIKLSNCIKYTNSSFNEPTAIFVDSTHSKVYIANENGNSVVICNTDKNHASLTDCHIAGNDFPRESKKEDGITGIYVDVPNKKAYICAESAGAVVVCDTDGEKLSSCVNSEIKSVFGNPNGIFFVNTVQTVV